MRTDNLIGLTIVMQSIRREPERKPTQHAGHSSHSHQPSRPAVSSPFRCCCFRRDLLMEAVEDTNLEAAIGWLTDTILANLPAGGKLESWIRQAGLGNDVEELKSEVEAVEMVVSAVQGRAAGNKPLAKSLARVKERL